MADTFDLNDSEVVDVYDDLPVWSAVAGQMLLRHVPLSPRANVLDVACGAGFPTLELAQRLGPAASVTGIDPWAAALARARRKATIWGVHNVTFIEGDASAIPFPASCFDLIVSNLGLNNFADAAAVLAECRRVARPGAHIALATNLQGTMAEFYAIFRTVLDASAATSLDAHIAHRATIPGTFLLLQQVGFEVLRTVQESMAIRFANGTAFLRHSFIRIGFMREWRGLIPQSEWAEMFERLRAALDNHAAKHGGLELSVPIAYVEAQATTRTG
jgi:arsenite methyltransferase